MENRHSKFAADHVEWEWPKPSVLCCRVRKHVFADYILQIIGKVMKVPIISWHSKLKLEIENYLFYIIYNNDV